MEALLYTLINYFISFVVWAAIIFMAVGPFFMMLWNWGFLIARHDKATSSVVKENWESPKVEEVYKTKKGDIPIKNEYSKEYELD